MRPVGITVLWLLMALSPLSVARAQSTNPKHEFRGAWIATISNLDWPVSPFHPTSEQKTQLTAMMDGLADAGINAVFFQIRSESDAMYASAIEPWSRHLTGTQGRAPDPLYDPLEYAIELAHERGMELHAWFNPFRAEANVAAYPIHPTHVMREHPEWILVINGDLVILNPGLPEVRDYVVDVIIDVVRRYDIDGVHFDDYFYPEPPDEIGTEDQLTFDQHGGGFSSIADWRRDNIDRFVRQTAEAVAAQNPDLKFGISPFGIWRSGVPEGIVGLSSVDVIYGDARNWLDEGWVDYLVPQLYWPFGGKQDFGTLAPWWVSVSNGRHIYPGLAAYRVDPATTDTVLFGPQEIPDQIRFGREIDGIQGNVLFRAANLTRFNGVSDFLRNDLYATLALTPVMSHRDVFSIPGAPDNLTAASRTDGSVDLRWDPSIFGLALARRFGVYRIRTATEPDPRAVTNDPANLLAVTYGPEYTDRPENHEDPYYYMVTGISANSMESDESNFAIVDATSLASERVNAIPYRFTSVAPNPMNAAVEIRFELDAPSLMEIRVYDVLGRARALLVDGDLFAAGSHVLRWDGVDISGRRMGSGTYFLVLSDGTRRITRGITIVR